LISSGALFEWFFLFCLADRKTLQAHAWQKLNADRSPYLARFMERDQHG